MSLLKNSLFQMVEETVEAVFIYVAGVYLLSALWFFVF